MYTCASAIQQLRVIWKAEDEEEEEETCCDPNYMRKHSADGSRTHTRSLKSSCTRNDDDDDDGAALLLLLLLLVSS